jgi:hypothetical protein
MSIKQLVIVTALLGSSSLALADASTDATADKQRKWTILAAENHATKGAVDKRPEVSDPGVFVTAQRDPQNTK